MVWKELQGGPTTTQSWFNLHKLSGLCRLTTVHCWMDSMILFKEISHCMLFCDSLIHIYNTGGQLTLLRVEKIFSAILIFSNAFEEWKSMRITSKWNRDGRLAQTSWIFWPCGCPYNNNASYKNKSIISISKPPILYRMLVLLPVYFLNSNSLNIVVASCIFPSW